MMRGLVLLFLLVEAAPAQPRYWIFFDAKGGAEAPAVQAAPASPRALSRRALRGAAGADTLLAPVPPAYLSALEALGVRPARVSRWLNAASAPLSDAQREAVRALPFVRRVQPVGRMGAAAARPAPPPPPGPRALPLDYGASYGQLARIDAIAPLERGINGAGVVLGFLDTEFGGFQHPAFERLRRDGRLLGQQNFTPAAQSSRHGQNVASIAAGYAPGDLVGPAWGASILGATTEFAPTETNAEEDAFVAGLEWLEGEGVDVVNTSLGYTTFDEGQRSYTPADLDGDTGVTTRAADAAVALGVVVVASAGNEGCDSPAHCWYYIGTPADGDGVIAVGAVNPDSTRAGFSSLGPTADGRVKPDVAAQGVQVRFATGAAQYAWGSGTSFSAPLVAGVAAQMLQANPGLSPAEVRALLRQTASQADAPDTSLGWGIVDADAAVRAAALLGGRATPGIAVVVLPDPGGPRQTFVVRGEADRATLTVFDALGRRVATPFAGTLSGVTRVSFDADLPSGLYLFALTTAQGRVSGTFYRFR